MNRKRPIRTAIHQGQRKIKLRLLYQKGYKNGN